jgi:ABC-type nitrate/sulfonate/bicarbonate transport system substrate-binding protein
LRLTRCARKAWIWREIPTLFKPAAPGNFLGLEAASITTPHDTRAAFQGFNYVIDGRELRPPYVATGFVTLRSIIAKRPKVISQFMHMMAESYKIMVTDRDLAFRLMTKKIGLTDRKVFDAAYGAELKVLEPRLDIKPIAIRATLDEIAKTDPRAKQVKSGAVDRPAFSRRDGERWDV